MADIPTGPTPKPDADAKTADTTVVQVVAAVEDDAPAAAPADDEVRVHLRFLGATEIEPPNLFGKPVWSG
jgi:hypothetical protein